ncbi:hypothetical protein [Sulfobacillus harzensis]|uniref:Uncharacterized protein n=1 Tax=Sulfobacillus harzensis TaxID=2729629 RepID=A0A7Y0L664_9FIRM|nr:hypothetical protein [Sulfobacillus harzensis]NMP23950.1 hypothetical protein [Sulfobacillus harzensis]
MKRMWVTGIFLLAVGVAAGFLWGRYAPQSGLRAAGDTDIEQAAWYFHTARHEPAPSPRARWTSEGMGYLRASVQPLTSLGVPRMQGMATAVNQAAYDVLVTHKATPQEHRLFTLFQREFYSKLSTYGTGPIPTAKLKQAAASVESAVSGR